MKKLVRIIKRTLTNVILCLALLSVLVSCASPIERELSYEDLVAKIVRDEEERKVTKVKHVVNDNGFTYTIELGNYLYGSEIWTMESQSEAQALSMIVKSKSGELIIFDGGRKEDAEYLHDFIVRNGGRVSAWFLTHIHDDHIGAIIQIMTDYDDIFISDVYYNFADVSWYYQRMGNDVGIVILFEEKCKEFKKKTKGKDPFKKDNKKAEMQIHNRLKMDDAINVDNVKIEVLNNIYKLDEDPVNNSSIVYKAYIDKKTMIVLGDLAYKAGEKILLDNYDKLKSDIVVMAHHGQNGVGEEVYKAINPSIAIWPTTTKIYDNVENKYTTDETKAWIKSLNVNKEIFSFEGTSVIR